MLATASPSFNFITSLSFDVRLFLGKLATRAQDVSAWRDERGIIIRVWRVCYACSASLAARNRSFTLFCGTHRQVMNGCG
jgi:hypothetical protein